MVLGTMADQLRASHDFNLGVSKCIARMAITTHHLGSLKIVARRHWPTFARLSQVQRNFCTKLTSCLKRKRGRRLAAKRGFATRDYPDHRQQPFPVLFCQSTE
jgi:hypothetical protein